MGCVPVQLPPPRWGFDPTAWPPDDAVAVGADLEPATLLAAYRSGLFPMPLDEVGPMVWWSPQSRGVLRPDRLRVSRSLRQATRRYETRVDTDFDRVLGACADRRRPGAWISMPMQRFSPHVRPTVARLGGFLQKLISSN